MRPIQLNDLVRRTYLLPPQQVTFYIVIEVDYPNLRVLEIDYHLTMDVTRNLTLHEDGVYRDNAAGISDSLYEFLGPSPIKLVDIQKFNEPSSTPMPISPVQPVRSPVRSVRSPVRSPVLSPVRSPVRSVQSPVRSPVRSVQ